MSLKWQDACPKLVVAFPRTIRFALDSSSMLRILGTMGSSDKSLNCERCGKPLRLASPPDGPSLYKLACPACEGIDPMECLETARWLSGELRPPRQ
jgi:hypothetical protein